MLKQDLLLQIMNYKNYMIKVIALMKDFLGVKINQIIK